MREREIHAADSLLKSRDGPVEGAFVRIEGETFYRISNYDTMPPFLMSIVSESDLWLFISSNGALTAGRRDPDHALFPYYTDDRIHDSRDQTGSRTLLRVGRGTKVFLWEPFGTTYEGLYKTSRNLYKSAYGNKIAFEEINHDLGLTFSYSWMTSERFGFVRRAILTSECSEDVDVELLDGIQNIMPYGLTRRFQLEFSTLADGYRESEREPETGMGLFKLTSIPTDRPEPSEALRATIAWSTGLTAVKCLLSASQLDRFRMGGGVEEETGVRGRRGAYFLNAALALRPRGETRWFIVADVNKDAVDVRNALDLLKTGGDLAAELMEDVARGTENLVKIVASADGLQATRDRLSAWRHFSNTLFNVMRGGVPDQGYLISTSDLASFVERIDHRVADRSRGFLESLPDTIHHSALLDRCREGRDPDLERITGEYMPITFSRRHGDPSRPWNSFLIDVKDDHGRKIRNYQGNWRDIFQNWEALALSFPGYIESMIFKFLNASTADGYNPYRITREGFEWELINTHDPWSFIGYWGDHQVVYLLRLLEESSRYHPEALKGLLAREVFTFANVPYRIKPYEALLQNPRSTIELDAALHEEIMRRVDVMGTDGKSLLDANGSPRHANLAEKLLIPMLSKLSNYIPEAGIWMNTQRPEWNDANNALVGHGVSMVTLYYLRRFLSFCGDLFSAVDAGGIGISSEVAGLFRRITDALKMHPPSHDMPGSDRDRKTLLDRLGKAGGDYRHALYRHGLSGRRENLTSGELAGFREAALNHIDHAIRVNRRPDGLYHSYNLMKVVGDGIAVRRLPEMLEGQVAVLSSGALSVEESVTLLDALRRSSLYRADQQSYLLYPDRRLPLFLEKNNIPQDDIQKSPLLSSMLGRGDRRIVTGDSQGGAHFNAAFRNAEALKEALSALEAGEYGAMVKREKKRLQELYEEVFDHQSFSGRSGTFYKYEGLGCVYWHMVSKLRLAVQEVLDRAVRGNANEDVRERLKVHYHEIREGIGVHKSPEAYGAMPIDPYSHTPSFAGAQQPGMTGQVKEDLIARLGEMGVRVEGGRLGFLPPLVSREEFLQAPEVFVYLDAEGREQRRELGKDSLAFTVCQVPVVAHLDGPPRIEVTRGDGSRRTFPGLTLDAETSLAVFERAGSVSGLDVHLGLDGVETRVGKG